MQPLPGAAGWRLSYPLNHADRAHESIVLLGASHFRAVALDTAAGQREEFPAFTAFWFERPGPDARARHFDALLDGPRVSGA